VASNNDKYGRNRNLWRKIYGSITRPPDLRTIIDTVTATTYSLDLTKIVRDRSFFYITQNQVTGGLESLILGEYDEGLISFNNESEKTVVFGITFTNSPIVVFTMEEAYPGAPNSENVAIFGFTASTTGSHLGVSAPFSGTVRYRAAFAGVYPSYFQSAFAPASGTFRASAGALTPNESFYTASYATLAGAPASFRQSPFDSGYSHLADVKLEVVGTPGASSTVSDITAHTTTPIHYIAYET
jgi:hypothetical protein